MTYSQATLEMCERHVAEGKRHIREQLDRIARMKDQGLDTVEAERLLATLKATLSCHLHHLETVRRQLRPTAREHGAPSQSSAASRRLLS